MIVISTPGIVEALGVCQSVERRRALDLDHKCNYRCYIMAANSRFAMASHIMTAVALKKGEVVNSTYLADSLNTNAVVVRRILADLQKAGLLETLAGRGGGARLAKAANEIFLYDVFAAVDDGELFAYNPNRPNKRCALSCQMKSVLTPIFESAHGALETYLKKVRLSDLVQRANEKCSGSD